MLRLSDPSSPVLSALALAGALSILALPAEAVTASSANGLLAGAFPVAQPAGKPFSDQFTNDGTLNAGWTLSEPNSNSFYRLNTKGLLLAASDKNGGSDLWPTTNYNGSLLLQPVNPALNWTVTIKEKFSPVTYYEGAGIVLTTQTSGFTTSSVFHRFEYANNPEGVESFTNGTQDPNYAPYSGKSVLLRLQKAGSTYTYSYSSNGKSWTEVSQITDAQAYTYIGLISLRQSYNGQTGIDAKPVFKYFKIKVNR